MITLGINCQSDKRNIGVEPCVVVPGQKKGHILVDPLWELDLTTETFNNAYVLEQVQLGNMRFVGGAFGVTTETPDDTKEESTSGEMSVVRKAMPVVTTTVKKGYEFQAGIYGLQGENVFGVLEIFETGIIGACVSKDGTKLTANQVGMYNVKTFQDNDGTNSASTIIEYQLTNVGQYNQDRVYLTNLDFDPNKVGNIIDVKLTGTADASDNRVYIKAVWARNTSYNISIFATANFGLTIDGVEDTISAVVWDSTNNRYSITPTTALTAGESVVVRLRDTTIPTAKVGNKFYKGVSPAITVVA